MEVEIRSLDRRDYGKAIGFAIAGMHFERYTDVPWELRLYGRYFLYMELERATQIIAAYIGERLVGVLMADMKREPKVCHSFRRSLYVQCFRAIMNTFYRNGASAYDAANAEMFRAYRVTSDPDGELCFLAADPAIKGKGIGSLLLNELERREKGKRIYLYTDSNCTYQFYEHRGFERVIEQHIEIEIHGKPSPLTCFLYSKTL